MTLNMYAIKDRLNDFLPMQALPNDETACRWFREMVSTNVAMQQNPNDFSIWKIGNWNTKTGKFFSDIRELVINAKPENNMKGDAEDED